jgi:hypothetical protein
MMVICLVDSLTKEAKAEMFLEADKYTISGYPDGLCFLEVLIGKAQVETIAMVNMLQSMINKLPVKIVELNGNIFEFNNHVKNIESSLFSYGEMRWKCSCMYFWRTKRLKMMILSSTSN